MKKVYYSMFIIQLFLSAAIMASAETMETGVYSEYSDASPIQSVDLNSQCIDGRLVRGFRHNTGMSYCFDVKNLLELSSQGKSIKFDLLCTQYDLSSNYCTVGADLSGTIQAPQNLIDSWVKLTSVVGFSSERRCNSYKKFLTRMGDRTTNFDFKINCSTDEKGHLMNLEIRVNNDKEDS